MAWWENEAANKWRQSVARWEQRLQEAQQQQQQQAPTYRPPAAPQQPQQVPSWYTPKGPIAGFQPLPYRPEVVAAARPLEQLPAMPPGAPEYQQVPTQPARAGLERDLIGQTLAQLPQYSWIFDPEQRARLPRWLQGPAEFVGEMTTGGVQRLEEAYRKPEERQFMPPVAQRGFEEYRQEAEPTIAAFGALAQVLPTPYMQQAGKAIQTLAPWLATVPAKYQEETKEWEEITRGKTLPRRLEQLTGAGAALLGEPAIALEEVTGATAIALRPESRGLTPRQWAPLTERTWSLAYRQLIGKPGTDELGTALTDIATGRATAAQIAAARESFGAELVGQMFADPLNILDAIGFGEAIKQGRALTQAQKQMAKAAEASPEACRAAQQVAGALAKTADEEVDALRTAAKAKGIEGEPGFWRKVGDALKSPWELTPASKAERDANELWLVLSGPISEAPAAEHATQLLADWATEPQRLEQFFGALPTSPAGEKASVILADIIDDIPKLPSADPAAPFNPAKFMVEVDELAMARLKQAYGYKEPSGLLKFANAWKGLMSEFYLTAIYSPGYVLRNTASDLTTMGVDGLVSFERVEDIDAYLDVLGGITTKRVTTGGKGIMEELTGIAEGESRLPGIFGKISKRGQEITRYGEPLGRLPIGEESRYKRAFYTAARRFFGENAVERTPDLPAAVRAVYGPRADDLIHRVAAELSPDGKRKAVEQFLNGENLGQMIEPTRYVDAVDLDAMSPAIARQVREEIGKLPPTATQDDVRAAFAKVRGTIDEDEARRLKDLQEIPTQAVDTNTDEMEIGDTILDELEEAAARSGDPELQKRAEEIRHAIPRIEEEIDRARGEILIGIQEEPTADGLDVLLAANRDAEAMRDETRRTLNQLRAETTEAYQTGAKPGSVVWPEYFTRTAESWEDLATQRVTRYQEAAEQLKRIRAGEPADQVLGMNRQQLAEMRLQTASQIPQPVEGPRGYMPGKVADAADNARFESFLNARRAGQDTGRSNAWRAAYGADPQDYGKVVDLLDSAERDVDLYGKAAAGRVAEHRAKAFKDAARAYRKHRDPAMARLAADRVWEKYYALRNDEWRKFFEAAEQRWKIAERDVLTNNFRSGPRMEPPAPLSKVAKPAIQPGDAELVRRAALTPEAQWSKEQAAAVRRWTGNGKAMPDVEQLVLPAAKDFPPYTRAQFTQDVKRIFNLSDEEADAVIGIADARANAWAARTGRDPSEWFTARLAGFGSGEEIAGGALFQRAPDEGSQAFRSWFRQSKVLEAETGNPKIMYHGTSKPGFRRFDPTFQDPNALYGPGFYFTDDPQVAGGWYEMERVHTYHPTKEAAQAVPDQVYFNWREDYGAHAGEWVAVVERPKLTKRGYAHKMRPDRIAEAERARYVDTIRQSAEYKRAMEHTEGPLQYLTVGERASVEGKIRAFEEHGARVTLGFLEDQPYNIPVTSILERSGLEGPGAVYPVYLSLQNPIDMERRLTRAEAGRMLDALKTAPLEGLDLPDTLDLRGVVNRTWEELKGDFDIVGRDVTPSSLFNEILYQLRGQGLEAEKKGWVVRRWVEGMGYDGITHTGGAITGVEPHQVYIAFQPTQIKSAANVGTFDPMNPDILAQAHAAGKKGAAVFLDDGRAIIHAFKQGDVSTVVHELGHVFRRELDGIDLRTIEKWAGVRPGKEWSARQEEKFARAFERYLAEGSAPTQELGTIFERFKQWLTEIYRSIVGSDIDVQMTDEIRGVFDRLLDEAPELRPGDEAYRHHQQMEAFSELVRQKRAAKEAAGEAAAPPPPQITEEETAALLQEATARMGTSRTPLSIDDAAELYGTGEEWQSLAAYLDRQYKHYAELSDPKHLDDIAHRWAHKGQETWIDVGGELKQTNRSATRAQERAYRRSIVGDNPRQFYKRNGEMAQWYYDLMADAQAKAAGQPVPIRTPPEWIALEAIAAEEGKTAEAAAAAERGGKTWAESVLFQGKRGKPERIDPGLARQAMEKSDQRTHVWTHYIQEHYKATGDLAPGADAADLYTWLEMNMPDELDAITMKPKAPKPKQWRPFPGKKYQTPKGIGEAVSVESGRGAKNAWIKYPDGTTEKVPFDQLSTPAAAPPTPAAARPARPAMERTGGGYHYVTNAEGTGGRSFEPGKRGLAEAKRYYAEQVRLWDEVGEAAEAAALPADQQDLVNKIDAALQRMEAQRARAEASGSIDAWERGYTSLEDKRARILAGERMTTRDITPEAVGAFGAKIQETQAPWRGGVEPAEAARLGREAARPAMGAPPAAPQQAMMWEAGEELPLFSQTAPRAEAPKFAPPQAAAQPTFPGMEPEIGEAAKYAARPAGQPTGAPLGEGTAELEALRPKKIPKGQQVLWQEASPMDHPWVRQIERATGSTPELTNGWLLPDGQYSPAFGHDIWAERIGGQGTTLREFITETGTPRVTYIGGDPSITFGLKPLTTSQRRTISGLIRDGYDVHTWIMIPGTKGAGEYKALTNVTEANAFYRRLEQLAQTTGSPDAHPWISTAKRYFGVTRDNREAGFVLADGTMLDFSGRSQGAGTAATGRRYVDHSDIWQAMPDDVATRAYPDATHEFMRQTKAMRVSDHGDWAFVHLTGEPTEAQRKWIMKVSKRAEIEFAFGYPDQRTGRMLGVVDGHSANPIDANRILDEIAESARRLKEQHPTVLWQDTTPGSWALYQEQAAKAGATHGPGLADIVQNSTKATHRALDQMQAGILQDWAQWQPGAANQATRRMVGDWLEQQVIPEWHTTRAVGLDYARAQADYALLDYSKRRNFDVWLSYIAPYHYWFTRSGANWAKRLATRPGMLAEYVRVRSAMKQANENAGRRQRFEGKLAIPFPWLPDWMGENLYIDPIKFMIPFANLYGTNWDDADESRQGLQKAFHTLGQVGFRPFHFWELPYQAGWIQKAGEALGMEKEAAARVLGPETQGDFGLVLPQSRVIQSATALAREAGAEAIPPGGINIEAPLRQLLGLPAGEVWDPYRQSRMLANLAAEDPTNLDTARTALMAQELLRRDEDQTGKVWSMESELAQQTAQELGWTPDELLKAQQMLQKAMQRAAMERAVGTVGWALGPGMAIEPTGERAQLELAEQARQQTWTPETPGGSREGYQAFKDEYPALYPRSTQYTIMPGEEPGTTMEPGYRANWLAAKQEKDQINAEIDQAVDDLLRAEPWNWAARGELEDQRRAALDEIKARYPTGEISGDIPAILYGMAPAEMWDSTVEDELYQMQEDKPQPEQFTAEEGAIDWASYYDAIDQWKGTLPKQFTFGQPEGGAYQGMAPAEALDNFEQRYDSPLEAAYKTYQDTIASPAWDAYHRTDDFKATVGRVGQVKATDLIPAILEQYKAKGWTEEELAQELQGVTFPSLTQQLDLKKAQEAGQAGGQAGTQPADRSSGGTSTGKTYTGSLAWLSDPKVYQQMEQQVSAEGWRAVYGKPWWENYKRGGYGGGGGGSSRSGGSSWYRWRPPETIRGGPWKF